MEKFCIINGVCGLINACVCVYVCECIILSHGKLVKLREWGVVGMEVCVCVHDKLCLS